LGTVDTALEVMKMCFVIAGIIAMF
jgi:hypothetical protein